MTKNIYFTAFNGSLISSLTSPTLSKPLETFEEILKESSKLAIITQPNSAAEQYMSSGSNKVLKKLQDLSEKTHWNNSIDGTKTILTVLDSPNRVYFSDMALFMVKIYPPSGSDDGMFKKTYLVLFKFCSLFKKSRKFPVKKTFLSECVSLTALGTWLEH